MGRCWALAASVVGIALAAGCTPTGVADREVEVAAPVAEPVATPRVRPPNVVHGQARPFRREGPAPGCGRIALLPAGPWERNERLAAVRDHWYPRAEHGRPVAIRTVTEPLSLPDHQLFQVQVEHAPHTIQPCWLSRRPHADENGWSPFECLPAEVVVPRLPAEVRPRRARPWAELLGTFDDATAVFASDRELDRCVTALPAEVRATIPPLGVRRMAGEEHITFVEWIDIDELSLVLTVEVVLEDMRLEIERHELMMIDHREGGR